MIKLKKNKWIILGVALTMGALLAGCGKEKKDEKTESATTTQAVVATYTDVTPEPELPRDEDGYIISNDFVKTIGDTINVRTSPSTDASIYVLLSGGEVLNRVGYNEEWTKVLVDGQTFYIYSDYVVQTEPPEGYIPEEKPQTATETDAEQIKKKVVIDPCNQAVINADQVPIGPDTETTKQGASVGNVGTNQGTKESELNLTYAKLLKAELETRGYEVVLTREVEEVNLTNKERAELANESGATTFVRIQMNFSENDALTGIMAVCMPENSPYNGQLHGESYKLSTRLLQGVLDATACSNQGILETDQLTGMNWSQIPVATIKLGYLSNGDDENRLIDAEYQQKVVKGLADGLDYYYGN